MQLKTKRFDKTLPLPKYEKLAAGFDLSLRTGVTIKPGEIKPIPANIAVRIPEGYVLLLIPRSSTPFRTGLIMPNSVGVIDPFFAGGDQEIMLIFQNITKDNITVKKGDRLVQGILVKYEKVEFDEVDTIAKLNRRVWKERKRRK